jgi:mitochondrial fission protein ELM1
MKSSSTWILTEGFPGTEGPCRGLALALGLEPVIKRVKAKLPWDWLPARLWFAALAVPTADSDPLEPPWPDLLISSGNVAAPLALAIKRRSAGATSVVHIQNPKLPLQRFDLVIAARHDRLDAPNVVTTDANLHTMTRERLAAAAEEWRPRLAHLPRPLIGVLVGGPNRRFRFAADAARQLADQLADLARATGCGLAITPSRRTGAGNVALLRERLAGAHVYFWDESPPNPYVGLLALADAIVVTQDSVSMISEALATAKPVYWVPLAGHSRRLQEFVDRLTAEGRIRRFRGVLESWSYAPPDDNARAAAAVRRLMKW